MNPYDAGSGGPAGKLIRNRSTKANDDWWRAVQDAAMTAPKLTYERNAPMANEDEICCRCFLPIHRDDSRDYLGDRIAHKSERCIYLLAAALREARKDRDDILGVLKFTVKNAGIFPKDAVEFAQSVLDAAMKPPGGEGSSHE